MGYIPRYLLGMDHIQIPHGILIQGLRSPAVGLQLGGWLSKTGCAVQARVLRIGYFQYVSAVG